MTAVEIVGLLEILRNLLERKAELDREFFCDFIQPIWESFAAIHKDYKRSFRRYLLLVSIGVSEEAMLDQINQDEVLSSDLRSELGKCMRSIPVRPMRPRQAHLSEFLRALEGYFSIAPRFAHSISEAETTDPIHLEQILFPNPHRYDLRMRISSTLLRSGRKWLRVRIILLNLLARLQGRFDYVAEQYDNLRRELLK